MTAALADATARFAADPTQQSDVDMLGEQSSDRPWGQPYRRVVWQNRWHIPDGRIGQSWVQFVFAQARAQAAWAIVSSVPVLRSNGHAMQSGRKVGGTFRSGPVAHSEAAHFLKRPFRSPVTELNQPAITNANKKQVVPFERRSAGSGWHLPRLLTGRTRVRLRKVVA